MKVADLQMMRSNIRSIDPNQRVKQNVPGNAGEANKGKETQFADVLQSQMEKNDHVQFSSHAVKRLEERTLDISTDEISRLNQGVKQVAEKGGVNSLIMVDNTAFVVSVRNNTVITAMDKNATQQNVFTNIDSVAFV